MAFSDPTYVSTILGTVCAVLGDAFADASRPVDCRRFPGVPSWDCEMVAVWPQLQVQGVPFGTTSSARLPKQFRHTLTINVLLLRCVTVVTDNGIPSNAQVDSDGAGFATDQWILERAITQSVRDGTLTSGGCQIGRVTPVTPQQPQGGLSGMTTSIELGLG